MKMTIKKSENVKESAEITNFDIIDKKNRTVGAYIKIYEVNAVEINQESTSWHSAKDIKSPGHFFAVFIQATRNDETFGPTKSSRYFKTASDRNAYIQKRCDDMKKRAYNSFK